MRFTRSSTLRCVDFVGSSRLHRFISGDSSDLVKFLKLVEIRKIF